MNYFDDATEEYWKVTFASELPLPDSNMIADALFRMPNAKLKGKISLNEFYPQAILPIDIIPGEIYDDECYLPYTPELLQLIIDMIQSLISIQNVDDIASIKHEICNEVRKIIQGVNNDRFMIDE